jgi:hypothetical protein
MAKLVNAEKSIVADLFLLALLLGSFCTKPERRREERIKACRWQESDRLMDGRMDGRLKQEEKVPLLYLHFLVNEAGSACMHA